MFYWRKHKPQEVICTICSKKKDASLGLMPASRRYLGGHIKLAQAVALSERRPLFILSGMFGLIAANRDIPHYDRRLEWDKVDELAARVAQQITWHRIRAIRYYRESEESWAPYTQALVGACEQVHARLMVQALPTAPKAVEMPPETIPIPALA